MATATSPPPEERSSSKRMKQEESGTNGRHAGGSSSDTAYHSQQHQQQRYPPPQRYGGPPPPPHMGPGPAFYGAGPNYGPGPHPHYSGPPPPPGPPYGPPPPSYPRGMPPHDSRQGPPPPSDPGWNGDYRGSNSKSRIPAKSKDHGGSDEPPLYYPPGPPPPHYNGPPPPYGHPAWQGGPPPPHPPPPGPMYASQGTWTGSTPPRRHHRGDMYGPDLDGMPHYRQQPPPPTDDDGAGSSTGGSTKEKGRGSYKCGRCGVPKKGHVCPYQPKPKRRPDEPSPETRNAAVQVEIDEFMTLRRLNIRIQGFPESYVTEPYMAAVEPMVVGEPAVMHGMGMPPMDPHAIVQPSESLTVGSNASLPDNAGVPMVESRDTGIGDGTLDDHHHHDVAEGSDPP